MFMSALYPHNSGQSTLPAFINEMLTNLPRAGEGIHHWLFRAARQLHAHLPAVEIVTLLESRAQDCGRHVSRKEIIDAVQNAMLMRMATEWQRRASNCRCQVAGREPRATGGNCRATVADWRLWELSRPRIEDNAAHTETIIDLLFPGNPLFVLRQVQFGLRHQAARRLAR